MDADVKAAALRLLQWARDNWVPRQHPLNTDDITRVANAYLDIADAGRAAGGEILPPDLVARIRRRSPVGYNGDVIEALCDSHERLIAALAGLVEEAERFGRKKGFDVELGGSLYKARAALGGGAERGTT